MSMVIPRRSERKYEPYPEYKDSGAEWLGKVPMHWIVKRLKYSVNLINDKVETGTVDLPYIGLENVESWIGRLVEYEDKIEPESTSNRFQPKDILFGKLRPYLAKVVHAEQDGICSSELIVLRPLKRCFPRFLFYYLISRDTIGIVNSTTYGVKMPRANRQFIGNLPFPAIEMDEQQTIADFLDRETVKIDELTEMKRKLTERLQEQRTALITRTVTKGLNPDAPMKDSGVEWLGEIPAHWEAKKLKHLLLRNDGGVWGDGYDENGTVVLRSTEQTIDGKWCIDEPAIRRINAEEYNEFKLISGDLLITKSSGSALHIGKATLVTKEIEDMKCCFSNFMQRLRLLRNYSAKYVYYVFNCILGREQLVYYSNTTTGLANLSSTIIGNIHIAIPSYPEQQAIADYLDQETARIDTLVHRINQAIEKLQEYRTALITAAVTGKIDVREHVS